MNSLLAFAFAKEKLKTINAVTIKNLVSFMLIELMLDIFRQPKFSQNVHLNNCSYKKSAAYCPASRQRSRVPGPVGNIGLKCFLSSCEYPSNIFN
jgi:hypothetical protein